MPLKFHRSVAATITLLLYVLEAALLAPEMKLKESEKHIGAVALLQLELLPMWEFVKEMHDSLRTRPCLKRKS